MRSHVAWTGERNILYKKCVNLSRVSKTLRGSLKGKTQKKTIFANGGLGLLQMVSKPDTGLCANEDIGSRRWWIVRSHIGWRGERNIFYMGVEIFL